MKFFIYLKSTACLIAGASYLSQGDNFVAVALIAAAPLSSFVWLSYLAVEKGLK